MNTFRTVERPWKGISFLVLAEAGVEERDGLIIIPYRRRDGSLFRERVFAPDGRAWWGPGEGIIPFGLEALRPNAGRALLIAEGESDALTLRGAFADVLPGAPVAGHDVVAVPGASTWQPGWARYAEGYEIVYAVGDGDRAGRRMMDAILRDIPHARPVLLPPGEDARSLLQREGPRALDPLLARADARAALLAFLREHGGGGRRAGNEEPGNTNYGSSISGFLPRSRLVREAA